MPTRTYEVGPVRVFDHEPGSTFEADLDPVQEARLIESGALQIADGSAEPRPSDALPPEQLKELKALKRPELNALAEQMGIEDAGDLPNAGAVIDAIATHEGGSTEGDSQNG